MYFKDYNFLFVLCTNINRSRDLWSGSSTSETTALAARATELTNF